MRGREERIDKVESILLQNKKTIGQLADIIGCSKWTIGRYFRELRTKYQVERNSKWQFYLTDMQTQIFYNTIGLKCSELKEAIKETAAQDKRVLEFFVNNPNAKFTAWEVQKELKIEKTSVHRAMNTLRKGDFLEKTEEQRMGPYGKPNYLWRAKV